MIDRTRPTGNEPESPNMLRDGAWLPDRYGVLKWVEGAIPAEWQTLELTRCGSIAGWQDHVKRREQPCDLCAVARDYGTVEASMARRVQLKGMAS